MKQLLTWSAFFLSCPNPWCCQMLNWKNVDRFRPYSIYTSICSDSGLDCIQPGGYTIWIVCLYKPFLTCASIPGWLVVAKEMITTRFPKQLIPRAFSRWGTLFMGFPRHLKRHPRLSRFTFVYPLITGHPSAGYWNILAKMPYQAVSSPVVL